MPTARQKAAALMGKSKSPAKVSAARQNAAKATAARRAAAALRRAQKDAGKG